MHRFVRLLLTVAGLGVLAAALLCAATGAWLSRWVPTKGKAWVEAALEERLPLDVEIGAMRYSLWRGLILEDVSGLDPATQVLWFYAPALKARVGLLALLRQQVTFRLEGTLEAPVPTDLVLSGDYHLRSHELTVTIATSDIAVEHAIPELAKRLPTALKSGDVRLALRTMWRAGSPPAIAGRVTATSVRWEPPDSSLRFTGNVAADGDMTLAPEGLAKSARRVRIIVDRGVVEGIPTLQTVRDVAATLRLTNEQLTIEAARGVALDTAWELIGTIALADVPQADLHLRAPVDLAVLARQFPTATAAWRPAGGADVTVTCAGPLFPWAEVKLTAEAALRDVSVTAPRWPYPLDHVSGRLRYDRAAQHLVFESIAGKTNGAPFTLAGHLGLGAPSALDLALHADGDLSLLQPLLAESSAVRALKGPVNADLHLTGTTEAPQWAGSATMSEASAALRAWPTTVERINGTIAWNDREISTTRLAAVVDRVPVVLTATLTDARTAPHVVGEAAFPLGSIAADATWQPRSIAVERATLTVGDSSVHVRGQISRAPGGASALSLSGRVDPSDLPRLPWKPVTALKAWQAYGPVDVQLTVNGVLSRWRELEAHGTARAEALTIRELPVRELEARLDQQDGHLGLHVTRALIAGGLLTGDYRLDWTAEPQTYLTSWDVIRIDLAQLAASIPAWRGRRMDGIASAHATLTGAWQDRESLLGEGWINATGERLADLPLLNRLLKGLFGVLADRLGLSSLRTAQITTISGQWQVQHQRLSTDDLRLLGAAGREPIAIYARGSVGFDATLDLVIEPELSEQLVLQAPTTSALSSAILKAVGGLERLRRVIGRHHLGGTIDKPDYKFELSLDQLLNHVLPGRLDQLF